jgi:ribonuclease HI
MAVVTPAQLLLSLAEHGSLEKSSAALGVSLDEARSLLRGAATSLQRSAAPAVEPIARRPGRKAANAASPTGLLDAPADHPRSAGTVSEHRRLRVYSDGASRGNPGVAGAGAVIEDEGGRVLERLGRFLGEQTNNVAEYEGLLLGLRRAQELGAREVEVLADSELLIRQLQGRYQVKNPTLQRLHAEAMALLRVFAKASLKHIPRAQNGAADEMSNRAIDERM